MNILLWILVVICRNPSLGLPTKARVCKRAGQERDSRMWKNVRMNSHTPKWTPMLGVGVPTDSRIFRERLQGSKPIALKSSLYHWKKLLKRRCLKWARMTNLDIWNTSYGQKKGRESNRQSDFRPHKLGNQPDFLAWRWHAILHWKGLDEGYNFGLNLISIKGLHKKL